MIHLVTQMRNESKRVKEWIQYHNRLGIENFVLFDDNSTDNTKQILKDLSLQTSIEIFDSNKQGEYVDTDNPNLYGINDAVKRMVDSCNNGLKFIKENYDSKDWICFIECDEFLVPQNDESLSEILNSLEIGKIYVKSYDFKCPFDLDKPILTQTFNRWSEYTRRHGNGGYFKNRGKSIARVDYVSEFKFIHEIDNSPSIIEERLKINHYRNNGQMQIYDEEDKQILKFI